MKQNFSVEEGKVKVTLEGSLYVEEAAVLREKLLDFADRGYKNFMIDMTGVEYIDSSGLGVLVAIQKRALQKGGGVILAGLAGVVKELFELTRLHKVFEIIESLPTKEEE